VAGVVCAALNETGGVCYAMKLDAIDINILRAIAEYRMRIEEQFRQGRLAGQTLTASGLPVELLLNMDEKSEARADVESWNESADLDDELGPMPENLKNKAGILLAAAFAVKQNYYSTFTPKTPRIMGILNVTPDSFSDGGKFFDREAAVSQGLRMAEEGAAIIDVGGESTRPGAKPVEAEEEIKRVVPVIRELADRFGGRVQLSVDTSKSEVARVAIEAGATMINDISALRVDPEMASVAAGEGTDLVLMHIQGEPRTMQKNPRYDDLLGDVYAYLCDSVLHALDAGVVPARILVDPGMGFGKSTDHNLELIRRLRELAGLGLEVMFGCSRKSMFGNILHREDPGERVYATVAANTLAQVSGVDVLRVHDVRAAADAVQVVHAVQMGEMD
jgi:dihydropteroate synthase